MTKLIFQDLTPLPRSWNHRKVTDTERAESALKAISGKRLTYRRIGQ